MSPAILTETVWALAREQPTLIPDRVVAITTIAGRQAIERELLQPSPTGGIPVWEELRRQVLGPGCHSDPRLIMEPPRLIQAPNPRTGRTDWIEDIMLRTVGPQEYDKWVNHEFPWTDPRVKKAWEMFGQIALNKDYVFGGTQGVLSVDFGDGADAVYSSPPHAYLHRQALFMYDFVRKHFPDLKPGEDVDFFMVPPIDPQFGNPAEAAGEMLIMFRDTPANRDFMNYWVSADAQKLIVQYFGRLSSNSQVPAETYNDPLLKKGAELLTKANAVRFDASDLMPSAIGAGAFWKGVVDYVNGKDLDTVLKAVEEASVDAYKQ